MNYFMRGRTLVLVVDTIADPSAPTLAELAAGTNISGDLWLLDITPRTSLATRTPWKSVTEHSVPTRYSVDVSLGGYRHIDSGDEVLWPLCATFGAPSNLVIRRGLPHYLPLAAGQTVEVYTGRWGKRGPSGSDRAASFQVPFYPSLVNDDAVVAA